ncbi:MAG: alpha-L-rhamnosidase C-terminal domain-containing protein [Verrucomicrobiae bacterium]
MRVNISKDLYDGPGRYWAQRGYWPASWIGPESEATGHPEFSAFRRQFFLETPCSVRIHVSADERYQLFLDGSPAGCGPERGDPANWFFESYEFLLDPGPHVIVAQVWSLGPDGPSPYAQMSVRHAFLLCAEGDMEHELSTGIAGWQHKRLGGISLRQPAYGWEAGAKISIHAAGFDWGFETGAGEGWQAAANLGKAVTGAVANEQPPVWQLRPALLPPMIVEDVPAGRVRHVQEVVADDLAGVAVRASENLPEEAEAWSAMLRGERTVTVPPRTMRRVIVDLEDYFCAYPVLTASGGAGASLRLQWAEALFEDIGKCLKGNRDEIEGKFFRGEGDRFDFDGGRGRRFGSLWWHAGRYLEVVVATGAQPLDIDALVIRQTHYPLEFLSRFECSDGRLGGILPMMIRTIEMCSHETYIDCPHFEQLMYVGDTRLEALVTYAMTCDVRLPQKAVLMFDVSRGSRGLTQSRYPSRIAQVIPPFSLWWVGMVHDCAMWSSDTAFVAARLPGVRATLHAFDQWTSGEGLLEKTPSWNFMDWVPAWGSGIPPDADGAASGVINLLYVHILRLAAELEQMANEPELSARWLRLADRTSAACKAVFFDPARGLFADDSAHRFFSEHAQCLAVLGGAADAALRPALEDGLFRSPDLERTSIYFTHYYFEACRILGRMDKFHERMPLWFDLFKLGLRTTVESPEPSRSDCHAWGAHPAFHYLATILGIRPGSPGFATVRIQPQLGPLAWARGSLPHPLGRIEVDVRNDAGKLAGAITLPPGLTGHLISNGSTRTLSAGRLEIPPG